MKEKLSQDNIAKILSANDYRSFIKFFIEEESKLKRFGFSDIARQGGFAARSFPRDVALGQKRITLNSLPKIIKGLGLTSDLAEYFRILVELAHTDCRMKDVSELKLQQSLEGIRLRLSEKNEVVLENKSLAYKARNAPQIYAALGNKNRGSTVKEIQTRTNLSEEEIFETLGYMLELKLIEKRQGRFFLKENHIQLQGLKTNEFFKKHFTHLCEKSIRAANAKFNSDEALFLSSAFSVRKSDLPQLKNELRQLLHRYIDAAEKDEGDKVVQLMAGMF